MALLVMVKFVVVVDPRRHDDPFRFRQFHLAHPPDEYPALIDRSIGHDIRRIHHLDLDLVTRRAQFLSGTEERQENHDDDETQHDCGSQS